MSETFKLLFVGRLSPHKNLTALLEALSMIKREITLDIVGDGECSREVRMLIADSKLENVRLHGRQSRDEVKRFYATCERTYSAFTLRGTAYSATGGDGFSYSDNCD